MTLKLEALTYSAAIWALNHIFLRGDTLKRGIKRLTFGEAPGLKYATVPRSLWPEGILKHPLFAVDTKMEIEYLIVTGNVERHYHKKIGGAVMRYDTAYTPATLGIQSSLSGEMVRSPFVKRFVHLIPKGMHHEVTYESEPIDGRLVHFISVHSSKFEADDTYRV